MKNKSKNIKHGQVILSKDKYFKNGKDTKKTRMTVTVATNKKDELALVKLYSKGIEIKGDSRFRSFKPYLYISDNENKPIKIGKKFKLLKNKIMEKEAVKQIVKETYENKFRSHEYNKTNEKLFRIFKKRK